jgi:hypothetical protein
MIRSFACRDTELVFDMERTRKFEAIGRQARRKLIMPAAWMNCALHRATGWRP